jgi:hypothetical protein
MHTILDCMITGSDPARSVNNLCQFISGLSFLVGQRPDGPISDLMCPNTCPQDPYFHKYLNLNRQQGTFLSTELLLLLLLFQAILQVILSVSQNETLSSYNGFMGNIFEMLLSAVLVFTMGPG